MPAAPRSIRTAATTTTTSAAARSRTPRRSWRGARRPRAAPRARGRSGPSVWWRRRWGGACSCSARVPTARGARVASTVPMGGSGSTAARRAPRRRRR
eukprot:4614274-Prymnesium_polylepis.1